MSVALSEATVALLDGRNYAVLATVNPDGSPQTSVVWVGRDGTDLLFSTVAGRQPSVRPWLPGRARGIDRSQARSLLLCLASHALAR
jgi:hypothetical protein